MRELIDGLPEDLRPLLLTELAGAMGADAVDAGDDEKTVTLTL